MFSQVPKAFVLSGSSLRRGSHMRRAGLVMTLIGLVLIPSPRALADGWPDVGVASRPAWVDAAAERRLRLLSALPAIQSTLHSQANAYFGSAGPGLSVGLVLDDGLYYSRGFGFADAQKTVVPDEYTIYRAGSLSKVMRSEEHTSELQSRRDLVCRLL